MRSLRWFPEDAVHIATLDAEHQELFQQAAEFREALLGDGKPARLDQLCRRLAAEANEHFAHEERLLREAEYPAYSWHARQHQTARSKLGVLERQVQLGDRHLMFEALESLAVWMRDHISIADRMASSYLRNYWRSQVCASV